MKGHDGGGTPARPGGAELAEALAEAIASLPPESRKIVELCCRGGPAAPQGAELSPDVEHPMDMSVPRRNVRTYPARLVRLARPPAGLGLGAGDWDSLAADEKDAEQHVGVTGRPPSTGPVGNSHR